MGLETCFMHCILKCVFVVTGVPTVKEWLSPFPWPQEQKLVWVHLSTSLVCATVTSPGVLAELCYICAFHPPSYSQQALWSAVVRSPPPLLVPSRGLDKIQTPSKHLQVGDLVSLPLQPQHMQSPSHNSPQPPGYSLNVLDPILFQDSGTYCPDLFPASSFSSPGSQHRCNFYRKAHLTFSPNVSVTLSLNLIWLSWLVISLLVDYPSPTLVYNPGRTRALFELNMALPLVLNPAPNTQWMLCLVNC